MKEQDIPVIMELGVYWYVDEDTKEVVFDTDEMSREFADKLHDIQNKFRGVKIDTEVFN